MTSTRHSTPPLYSQLEVSPGTQPRSVLSSREEQTELLRDVLNAQDRTNELLEDLVGDDGHHAEAARQRTATNGATPIRNWPPLAARRPRRSAACRSSISNRMTDDINDTSDDMVDGEFVLNEFIDRYGPRLAHLNGVIQVLAQL